MSGLLLGTVGGAAVAVCGAASCIWQVLHDLKLQQELLLPLLLSCVRTLRTVLTHATIRYILKVTFGLIRTPGAMMAYCLGEFEVLPSRTCRLFNPLPPYRFTDTENRLSVAFCNFSVHLSCETFFRIHWSQFITQPAHFSCLCFRTTLSRYNPRTLHLNRVLQCACAVQYCSLYIDSTSACCLSACVIEHYVQKMSFKTLAAVANVRDSILFIVLYNLVNCSMLSATIYIWSPNIYINFSPYI